MSTKQAHKIGFFSALSICIGSMVGIGIFLKNASVGKNLDGDGISWLITWILSGLIALMVAVHFGKISKIESINGTSGLSVWTDYIAGNKHKWFRKLVSFNYGFFYNAILTVALSFFTSELLIDFFKAINKDIKLDVWAYVLISIGFLLFFIFLNYFSYKISSFVSIGTTVLKFIPLIIVIIVGIAFANQNNSVGTTNGFNISIGASKAFKGIVLSIPSVLFAFDSFVGVGALSKQIKDGEKNISKIIVISLLITTIIYLLICISSIFHYNKDKGTTILNVLLDSLPSGSRNGITIFVGFFLFIAAFGTSNAIIGVSVKEFENMCKNSKILFADRLVKKYSVKKAGLILKLIIILFWILILFIPSMILNTDSIIDGYSNLVVAYFFLIYAFDIYLFWKNHYLKDEKWRVNSNKTRYSLLVILTIICVGFAIGANFFFVIFNGIESPYENSAWGLFLVGDKYWSMKNINVLIIYCATTPFFVCFPLINFYLIEKIEKIPYV